ncbi:hypothetical protein N7468_005781 [Penicillium chermesinum]|uniref:Uncharacterized protein n=1 Tax=Penicillium chermesinum TaxID=63820 RepID=A0A9W9TNA8_9EURO|nr:uncharacterized protein N7468_005781 [Penicillium chermesinum]KAJ5232825.1 hypothetical protein N7468_005781 [Penicillium chermesinum]KAJ6172480.1 hypothetical protein N7470_001547 [Penicillium chermesinum]
MSSSSKNSQASRMPNEFGSDYWVRNQKEHRHSTAGRGLFAGLQDVKHYNVENGWARRKSEPQSSGLFSFIYNKITGGAAYHAPTD